MRVRIRTFKETLLTNAPCPAKLWCKWRCSQERVRTSPLGPVHLKCLRLSADGVQRSIRLKGELWRATKEWRRKKRKEKKKDLAELVQQVPIMTLNIKPEHRVFDILQQWRVLQVCQWFDDEDWFVGKVKRQRGLPRCLVLLAIERKMMSVRV